MNSVNFAVDRGHAWPSERSPALPFLDALLRSDLLRARTIAERALERGLAYLYDDVVAAALGELDRLWMTNQVSIEQQYLATAAAQSLIGSLYPLYRWSQGERSAVVACVPGERHEWGARMFVDLLETNGWRVHYVAPSDSGGALLDLVGAVRPALVGLSVKQDGHVTQAADHLEQILRARPETRILVGGSAAPALGELIHPEARVHAVSSLGGSMRRLYPWK